MWTIHMMCLTVGSIPHCFTDFLIEFTSHKSIQVQIYGGDNTTFVEHV